jgi:primosomal protein N'
MPSLCVFDGESGIEKYIYVSVVFEENKKSFYYTTDDETISIGDKVLVPFGKNELEGEVVEIEICSECDVPFPLWKTKAIIKVMQKAPCEVHKGKESEE